MSTPEVGTPEVGTPGVGTPGVGSPVVHSSDFGTPGGDSLVDTPVVEDSPVVEVGIHPVLGQSMVEEVLRNTNAQSMAPAQQSTLYSIKILILNRIFSHLYTSTLMN